MRGFHSLLPVAAALLLACDQSPPVSESLAGSRYSLGSHGEHPAGRPAQPYPHLGRVLGSLRQATVRFHSIPAAEDAGYAAFGGCFQDPVAGGMGFHWANNALIADSAITPFRPELLVYEPLPNGERQLAAVEYIVFQDEWHAKGNVAPPRLFGQEFHLNPTLLQKPFYLLHVWVWKENPSGTFNDWNPRVSCPEV